MEISILIHFHKLKPQNFRLRKALGQIRFQYYSFLRRLVQHLRRLYKRYCSSFLYG